MPNRADKPGRGKAASLEHKYSLRGDGTGWS